MKLYVAIDAKTGDFFVPKTRSAYGRKRKVQAYVSEATAHAAMKQFWPRVEPGDYVIKEFTDE